MTLTPHFTLDEFKTHDGTPVPPDLIPAVLHLAQQLEVLRAELGGAAVNIHSGYRHLAYNRKVGSSDSSQHVLATAADIKVTGVRPSIVANTIEKLIGEGRMSQGGLGRYPTFVHYDTRGVKARWDET